MRLTITAERVNSNRTAMWFSNPIANSDPQHNVKSVSGKLVAFLFKRFNNICLRGDLSRFPPERASALLRLSRESSKCPRQLGPTNSIWSKAGNSQQRSRIDSATDTTPLHQWPGAHRAQERRSNWVMEDPQ